MDILRSSAFFEQTVRYCARKGSHFPNATSRLCGQISRLAVILLFCGCVGCGNPDGPFAISGTVLLEGQPLEQGSITFSSITAGSRNSTGGAIVNGAYSIAAEDGLAPGTYQVKISAADTSNATPAGLPANGLAFPSLIAPEFNDANHQVEVTRDGPNVFPFEVPKNKK